MGANEAGAVSPLVKTSKQYRYHVCGVAVVVKLFYRIPR